MVRSSEEKTGTPRPTASSLYFAMICSETERILSAALRISADRQCQDIHRFIRHRSPFTSAIQARGPSVLGVSPGSCAARAEPTWAPTSTCRSCGGRSSRT